MNETVWQPRILIVEDNPVNRALMSRKLRQAGYETVMLAKNGKEAVELALDHAPDLILMDMRLPEMSGLEVIEVLREKNHRGPIIVVSADADGADVSRSLKAGANDHIKKPVDFENLFRKMARLLRPGMDQPVLESQDVPEPVEPDQLSSETEEILSLDPEMEAAPTPVPSEEPKKVEKIEESFSDEVKMVFISDALEKKMIIEEALENDQFENHLEQIKAVAHEYKGTAPIFGLNELGDIAGRLDAGFKNNEPLPRLRDLTVSLLAQIKSVLESNS